MRKKVYKFVVGLTPNQWAAIIFWLLSGANTRNFLFQMGANAYWANIGAIVGQGLLTHLQHYIWTPRIVPAYNPDGTPLIDEDTGKQVWKKDRGLLPWASLIIDVMINLGGTWFVMQKIGATSSVAAILEAFDITGVVAISKGFIFVLSLIASYLLATAPEQLWRMNKSIPGPVPDRNIRGL